MGLKYTKDDVYILKRYISIASLISTTIAAILLIMFYRYTATNDILELGERNNLVLAKTVLNSVKKELIEFTSDEEYHLSLNKDNFQLPLNLNKAVQDIMTDSTVTRIKIFNKTGKTLFSTKRSQIGQDEKNSSEFESAMNGHIASKLIFRDTFSLFRNRSDEDNLVQSYLPIRSDASSPIHGVFEVYTDVSFIVDRVERTEVIILLGVFVIMLLLYGFLSVNVHYSARTIERQQAIIHERNKTLELLSNQMLNSQETEKKKISYLLHEDIAQTLSAIKNTISSAYSSTNNSQDTNQKDIAQSIQLLSTVIQEIRTLAMELRPASLDDFGLVKTIKWLCKEYASVYPDIVIETSFNINESILPASLKTIIYRVIQEALGSMIKNNAAGNVDLDIQATDSLIILTINDNCLYDSTNKPDEQDTIPRTALEIMQERTILSGGSFTLGKNSQGGTVATSTWEY